MAAIISASPRRRETSRVVKKPLFFIFWSPEVRVAHCSRPSAVSKRAASCRRSVARRRCRRDGDKYERVGYRRRRRLDRHRCRRRRRRRSAARLFATARGARLRSLRSSLARSTATTIKIVDAQAAALQVLRPLSSGHVDEALERRALRARSALIISAGQQAGQSASGRLVCGCKTVGGRFRSIFFAKKKLLRCLRSSLLR